MSDVAESQSPQMSVITKDHGFNVTKSILIVALVDLIEFFNVQNNFSDGQINTTAELVMDKFYWFKPEDFKLCFTKAKTGEYGVTYNRLDGGVIFEWLNRYEEERENYFATVRPKEHVTPVIRTNDVKEIHKLYDQVLKQSEEELEKRRYENLRRKACAKWNMDYDLFCVGKVVNESLFREYSEAHPLDEEYIDNFITKTIQNEL